MLIGKRLEVRQAQNHPDIHLTIIGRDDMRYSSIKLTREVVKDLISQLNAVGGGWPEIKVKEK